jgi:uncharacterized membrane protein
MADAENTIRCPNCGKGYRWKIELGGKKVQCKCGQKFRIPALSSGKVEPVGPPPGAEEPDLGYEIKEEDLPEDEKARAAPVDQVAGDGRCPSCGSKVNPGAVICLNCGFNVKEGRKVETEVLSPAAGPAPANPSSLAAVNPVASTAAADLSARADRDAEMAEEAERRHRFNERILPLILMGVGAVLVALSNSAYALLPVDQYDLNGLERALYNLILSGLRFVIQIPIMFVGIFIVARIFSSSYGSIGSAILKLMAIALCMNATSDIVSVAILFMTGGTSVFGIEGLMGWGASLIAFFILCAKFFDMDGLEGFVFWLILEFGPWIFLFFLGTAIASFFS